MIEWLFSGERMAAAPPGWDGNPSARSHRLPLAALALAGLGISTYLALFQLGLLGSVWDPLFGSGSSRRVLESEFSRALPVPDALLGAVAYAVETALELAGGEDRWARRPWLPLLFALTAFAAAAVSVLLTILQGAVFVSWCTLCLASAAIALVIAGPAATEALAALQFVQRTRRAGASVGEAVAGNERRRELAA